MKLIKFHSDHDWGQDYYLQVLFTKHWAFFQGCVLWCEYSGFPYLEIRFGMGQLISIMFNVYKFSLSISLFERTWKL